MIPAGRLRRRVVLERPDASRSADGGLVGSWVEVASGVPAEVLDLRGREYIAAAEAHARLDVKVRLRWRRDLRPTWRLRLDDGRVLDVVHVVDVGGRRRLLELLCTEEVS